jgi:hypothetical protein
MNKELLFEIMPERNKYLDNIRKGIRYNINGTEITKDEVEEISRLINLPENFGKLIAWFK